MALRLGDLHLPESPELRIPMLVRLPLERGLWIDSGRAGSRRLARPDADELRRLAMDTAVAHAARLLAVYPPGEFTVHVIDPAGHGGRRARARWCESGVLAAPPAAGAAGVSAVLARLTQRVDLVQMAVRGGAADSLPPDLDTAEQLLIVNDFPHGFDDRAVTQLRYLADEGPAVGVHLMMVADREDAAAYGPLLDPLWRSLLRLTPCPTTTSPTRGSGMPGRTSRCPCRPAARCSSRCWPRSRRASLRPWTERKAARPADLAFFYQSLYLSLVIRVLFFARRGVLPVCCGVPVNTDPAIDPGASARGAAQPSRVEETSGSDDADQLPLRLPEAQWMFP